MEGVFEPTTDSEALGQLSALTDFEGFEVGECPAIVRFSNFDRPLDEPDVMGMATKLVLPSGEISDFVAMSLEVFPVAHPRDLISFIDAAQSGPSSLIRFFALVVTRRLSLRASIKAVMARRRKHGAGFATTFHGVQTFRLVTTDQDGAVHATPMRYRWVPSSISGARKTVRHAADLATADGRDELARFDLEMTIPKPGPIGSDELAKLDNPRRRWRVGVKIRAGTLSLRQPLADPPIELGFNPATLAPGIETGPDDLFPGRQGAYALSHRRRAGEAADPTA